MRYANKGFTLIELITVIVILGALAAVVTPRFIDLQTEAEEAALEGVAGNLASAASTNFAGAIADSTDAVTVTQCGNIARATFDGTLPQGYSWTATSKTIGTANGDTASCAVTNGTSVVTFIGIAAVS